ncbi:MAG: hypothetical protein IPM82_08060 [Saprospiraceae bacterium]|nr:hypothetical protein [Saprospiraceae bacterium]
MIVKFCQPPPPLSQYVELLTWYADYQPDYAHERLLPQGVVELIIDLTDPPKFIYDNDSLAVTQTCRKAWIAGLRHEYITISAVPGSSMLVVRFRRAWRIRVANAHRSAQKPGLARGPDAEPRHPPPP